RATEDIRLLPAGDSFPHLLFQTRYRVNGCVDLCSDHEVGAVARGRGGDQPRVVSAKGSTSGCILRTYRGRWLEKSEFRKKLQADRGPPGKWNQVARLP